MYAKQRKLQALCWLINNAALIAANSVMQPETLGYKAVNFGWETFVFPARKWVYLLKALFERNNLIWQSFFAWNSVATTHLNKSNKFKCFRYHFVQIETFCQAALKSLLVSVVSESRNSMRVAFEKELSVCRTF